MTLWEATYIDSADRVCNDIVLGLTALSLASLGLVWVHMAKTMPVVRIIKPNDEPIHLIFWLLLSAGASPCFPPIYLRLFVTG
jgi:hypothetical protein